MELILLKKINKLKSNEIKKQNQMSFHQLMTKDRNMH
jgi:hypothetical protein